MRVLVTGGAGFIGSRVVAALTAAGHGVRVLDVSGAPAAAGTSGVDTVTGDVRDAETVGRALAGVDAVCHQAAMVGLGADLVADLPAYTAVNDLGTAVVLSGMAGRGIGRLVLASSMVVYGEGAYACPVHASVRPAPRDETDLAAGRFEPRCPRCGRELATSTVTEDAPLDPRNVYAATKVAQEHLAAAWARGTGGTVRALRYHNVYGPGLPRDTPYAGVAALFRSALRRGEAPRVFEDGGQRRDFVHVDDVADANLAALTAAGAPAGTLRAYNVASGTPRTIGDLAAGLAGVLGGPEPVVTGEYRLGDVRHVVASPERAHAELGFRARVPFATGLEQLASE